MESLEDNQAGARWLLPVLLSCGAVLLPLVSLQHNEARPRNLASRMDALPSSLELAARLAPERASRSGSRRGAVTVASAPIAQQSPTTTTVYVVPPPTTAPKVTASAAGSATPSTVRKRTTTTRKAAPKTTTTKAPAAAKSTSSGYPALREWTPPSPGASQGQSEIGQATWYKTADPVVCAHKTIAMGTILTVTNTANGKSTTCRVGDRGPFIEGRIVDLSPEAFSALAPLSQGVIDVKLTW